MENKPFMNNIGCCGFYCAACSDYNSKTCMGCHEKKPENACSIQKCTIKKAISNCSSCEEFSDIKKCHHHRNPYKVLREIFSNADSVANINMIKTLGPDFYALIMS